MKRLQWDPFFQLQKGVYPGEFESIQKQKKAYFLSVFVRIKST